MSRGHGVVQRHVLAVVRADARGRRYPGWLSVERVASFPPFNAYSPEDVAQYVADPPLGLPRPSRGRVESVRRACRRLEAEGLVETALKRIDTPCRKVVPRGERVYADERYTDTADRWMFVVRRALTHDERAAEADDRRKRDEQTARVLASLGLR